MCAAARRFRVRFPLAPVAVALTLPRAQAGGLLLCATSRDNLPPALVLELLQRISRVIKACGTKHTSARDSLRLSHSLTAPPRHQDYCGVLTEESLRKNFILVYELLDEMVDYGCAHGARHKG